MTSHLSADEHLAALDRTLSAERLAHASDCRTCTEALARTQAIFDAVRSDDVPEPSPLFWDHFSARVRAATAADPTPASSRYGWRVWVTLVSAAAACALVLVVRNGPGAPGGAVPHPSDRAIVRSSEPATDAPDAEPFAAVMQMASSLSSDDLTGVVSAAGGETPLVDDLNPAERAAFVRLLHAEMEKAQ